MLKKAFLKDASFNVKVTVLFTLVLFLLLVSQAVSTIFLLPYVSLEQLANAQVVYDVTKPGLVNALKMAQITAAILMFIIPAFLFAWLVDFSPANYLHISKKSSVLLFSLSVAIILAAQPIINVLAQWNAGLNLPQWMLDLEKQAEKLTEAFLVMNSVGDLLINLFMIGLLAAVGEELLFRGAIQRLLGEVIVNRHVVVWVTAILFSAFHMQFLGFVPRMLIGVLLGYLLQWTGSLWVPIAVHFSNNAMAVMGSYLIQRKILPEDFDKMGSGTSDMMMLLSSIVMVVFLIFLLQKVLVRTKQKNTFSISHQ